MLLDGAGEIVEMLRNSFPISFLVFVPILFLISPVCPATDFPVYRMQQYDLQGTTHGCRNALVNVEARPLSASVYTRKCVVTRLKELTMSKFKEIIQQSAGGVLVLLPKNLSNISEDEKEQLVELEHGLLNEEIQVPVYFTHETEQLDEIYNEIEFSGVPDSAKSAFEAITSSVNTNGFQFVVSGAQSKAINDFEIVNLQGRLSGYGMEEQLPTIIIAAHYDAFGIAPSLSYGTDSNGSGVVAILELARLFSKLYTNSRSHARFNLQFLLTGAGKFNYQGTKRWLDDQLESGDLGEVSFVICLDTIGNGNKLFAHVSKPPKEGSSADRFIKDLERVAASLGNTTAAVTGNDDVALEQSSSSPFEMIHKKINLAEDFLAWEHEKFSIKKKSAMTLSALASYKDLRRNTILDTRNNIDVASLTSNIKIIAEALSYQIYNLSSEGSDVFIDGLGVNEESVRSWLDYLSLKPRSAQLLTKDSPELSTLEQILGKYLKEVRRHTFKADKRDPEFVFYSGSEYTMSAYSVKPAIFDLFLAVGIFAYLAALYLISQNVHITYPILNKLNGYKNAAAKKSQ